MTKRTFAGTWARRALTIPLYLIALLLTTTLSPLLMLFAISVDLYRRNRWAYLRSLGFLFVYLFAENMVIYVGFVMWVLSGAPLGLGKDRLIRFTYKLEQWYGGTIFSGTSWLFNLNFEVEGLDDIKQGPALLFIRHASMADASLPGAMFVLRRKWHVRHVLKRELLWDPALDIIGNRAPNFFVRRALRDNSEELEGVRRTVHGMNERELMVIFPEGTRFSHHKRADVIKRLAEKGQSYFLEQAQALKHVLPPRLSGTLAMLEENTRACAVFMAHVGFESAIKALQVLNGSLIDKTIYIKMWHIPFDLIPKTKEQRIEWIYEQWRKIDAWVGSHLEPTGDLPLRSQV